MPIWSISDALAVITATSSFLSSRGNAQDKELLKDVRAGLRQLHFSELTITKLLSGDHSELGMVVVSQRDNRRDVDKSLERLATLLERDDLSLGAHKILSLIIHSKTHVRAEISRLILREVQGKGGNLDTLIRQIRDLNRAIEKADNQIGGILL